MKDTKIEVKLEQINKIINELTKVKFICYDENIVKSIDKLIKYIDMDILHNRDLKEKILDQIYSEMQAMKSVDEGLNASLYILYQELKNDRINITEAVERFDLILKTIEYM
ncbi:hypothetical protein CLHOM_06090 [Clostridium homopropionicum DSM 5847]|uniref:Uncharacterized protein n=1 Tax=Clostridium homopropionicum DSM 5847 TaxID=1121318 RepID=A0A0L6ZDG9_9CLOT|nr:hypothetical protein [Clostridium homopropionicum]KOA21021.1 hypothetical protein CLHOM_06090 [Clostridium homopropionicum DSM 5847]SFF99264.1 hypothetical protein SAMN04488501_104111 [Clostridium homopropionicum]